MTSMAEGSGGSQSAGSFPEDLADSSARRRFRWTVYLLIPHTPYRLVGHQPDIGVFDPPYSAALVATNTPDHVMLVQAVIHKEVCEALAVRDADDRDRRVEARETHAIDPRMRTIWTIYIFVVFFSWAILEAYSLYTGQMPLTGWVRAVTTSNYLASIIVFIVGAILLAIHFWIDVKPRL
jgi:hypothetical protein